MVFGKNQIMKTENQIIRIGKHLKEVVTIRDEKGNILHKIINPVMVEFDPKDVLQVFIGSAVLAIPVGFTEETWNLAQNLPTANVLSFVVVSLIFIALFSYYNYYRRHGLKKHFKEFSKRVISTYLISLLVVAFLLTLIQKAPWSTDLLLAFKRTILVAFPASMSGTIADVVK